MPSPVKKYTDGRFYRRKDGAWVKIKGHLKKVGKNKYKNLVHYSGRNIRKDYKRRAKKSGRLRRRYPQEYD